MKTLRPMKTDWPGMKSTHCIKMTVTSCAYLLPSMLAFGLFDKIWPQLLSAVWHHVKRPWKTGNPIPQAFRKEVKKKEKKVNMGYFSQ